MNPIIKIYLFGAAFWIVFRLGEINGGVMFEVEHPCVEDLKK